MSADALREQIRAQVRTALGASKAMVQMHRWHPR
jgi:hypothetical protein